jgi:hypothetical protein
MAVEGRHERLEFFEELPASGHREGADHAHVREIAAALVETEQQRADRTLIGLMRAIACDDAVGRTDVLDLEHDTFVGLIRHVEWLRYDAVEPGSLELVEPPLGERVVPRRGGDMDGCRWLRELGHEHITAPLEPFPHQASIAERE